MVNLTENMFTLISHPGYLDISSARTYCLMFFSYLEHFIRGFYLEFNNTKSLNIFPKDRIASSRLSFPLGCYANYSAFLVV